MKPFKQHTRLLRSLSVTQRTRGKFIQMVCKTEVVIRVHFLIRLSPCLVLGLLFVSIIDTAEIYT